MKRVARDDGRFDLFRLLDASAQRQGIGLADDDAGAGLLDVLASVVEAAKGGGTLVHGLHTEAMFAHLAAALDECLFVKSEDSGALYAEDATMRVPDYRLVTRSGEQLLVEVKNHHPKDVFGAFRIKRKYLDSLRSYAHTVDAELYVAIYWSHWQTWTLVHHSRFESEAPAFLLEFGQAMKWSEMRLLGDRMLGTVPPLAIRLLSNPNEPRSVGEEGEAGFTIGGVELLAGGEVVEDALEKKIAWFLMLFGTWTTESAPAEIIDGELISVDFEVSPTEPANEENDFEMIGLMSQMLSRQYVTMTSDDTGVTCLVPRAQPHDLGVVIPRDYEGKHLHLWRFELQAT